MTPNTPESGILFGVLALQAGLLDTKQFAEACAAWAVSKQVPLAEFVVQRGFLTCPQRALVNQLLEMALQKHGGDPQESIAAVATDRARRVLAQVADPMVQQSLAAFPPSDASAAPPTICSEPQPRARYSMTRLHATGGIGQIWIARDNDLGREVALKELRTDHEDSPALCARFVEEAKITGQLEHPGIVPVYELSSRTYDGKPFYAMRLVKGRTLADAVKDYHQKREKGEAGPLALRELLGSFSAICNAVAYAHSRHVLHRDLKPQNVILGEYGEVVVLDWGLAKIMETDDKAQRAKVRTEKNNATKGREDPSLFPVSLKYDSSRDETIQGQILGTPAYMPPEQATGRLDLLDDRSDVYGLGAILYEVLTGQPPFAGEDTNDVLKRVAQETPVPPRTRVSATPPGLEAICQKALARRPDDRYQTAKQLADDVERWLADEPVTAFRDPWSVKMRRALARHSTVAASVISGALIATAVLAGTALLLTNAYTAEREAKSQAFIREQDARVQQAAAEQQRHRAETMVAEAAKQRHMAEAQSRKARNYLNQVEESAKETVETRRQLQGEEHTQYAAALTSLANLYYSQGKYSLAEPLYRRALEINKKALGTSSADYANNLIYLARLLRYSGKPAQGEAMLLEASEIDRHALGEQHPQYTKSLIYLARTYQDMGQLDKAEPLYRKASEILRSSLGEDHPTYGESLGDLAKLCVDKGQYADAKKLSAQAEAILSKLGTQHPKYLNALLTHATTLARAGEYQQALAEISRVPAAMAYEDYVLYGVARVYGIAAQVVAAGNQLPQNERTRLADQFAAKSVQSLRDAAAAGFFDNSGNRARLTTEFRSLNSRADFKQFLLDLDPAGKPK